MSIHRDLGYAISQFELAYGAAVARPGSPIRLIERARVEVLQAVETLPQDRAVALLEEAARYVLRLAGHRNGGKTPAAA